MAGTMTFGNLTNANQQRLAATFFSIHTASHNAIMATINWGQASTDFRSDGTISGASFRTSISRILNRGWAALSDSDKRRFAAALWNAHDPRAAMTHVNWNAATTTFKPTGNPITPASFRTSTQSSVAMSCAWRPYSVTQ